MTLNCHIADLPEPIQDKFAEFRKIDVAAFGNLVWNIHHLFRELISTLFAFSKLHLFGNLLLRWVQSKHLHCLVEIL